MWKELRNLGHLKPRSQGGLAVEALNEHFTAVILSQPDAQASLSGDLAENSMFDDQTFYFQHILPADIRKTCSHILL